jgi:transcriptional regulator with XRE-family HTH domain
MTSFKQFLEEELLDEEFAEHYEEVSAEMDLALALAARREKLGLTQQQLAVLTGIKQPMIARIENGQMPTPRTLQRLAKALKVGLLFTGDGILLLPMAGASKSGVRSVVRQPVPKPDWSFAEFRKIAERRQRVAEVDYHVLSVKRLSTSKEYGKNASLATAA